jgi:hypothetical protein
MLAEVLAALASTGSSALVTAMVTDGWEDVKSRFARLLGRGRPADTQAVAAQLDQSHAELASLAGPGLERAQAEQEIAWRTRFGDFLARHPAAEQELRDLVTATQAHINGSVGRVQQFAVAHDQAQQAVQGHGVQNVTFGGQRGPGPDDR